MIAIKKSVGIFIFLFATAILKKALRKTTGNTIFSNCSKSNTEAIQYVQYPKKS